ncbi:ABC transporter permease [Bacillus horti]|uniref:ABC-2 type transport system permease protein n=1 Tax=Caldalkalibacillus horti TaxID=77523 RepID=A0ABT9VUR3_9BACI|nr:ABC transporter permease [Bacillus horti]MDQ0164725.1 ABC-2 type transport system permease protein [Bacillus horti]
MIPVFLTQWLKERRSPLLVLMLMGLGIALALLFASNMGGKLEVKVFTNGVEEEEALEWISILNEGESIDFQLADEEKVMKDVREGRLDVAVKLVQGDYRIITASDNYNVYYVERYVQRVMEEEVRLLAAIHQADNPELFRLEVEQRLQQPLLTLETQVPDGSERVREHYSIQLFYAFTLFMSMFIIGFKVNAITEERVGGIWERMILSPVRKIEIYLGHMLYTFMIGFAQVLVVCLLFIYIFGFDMGERFGLQLLIIVIHTFACVALATLFTGVFKTPEQFGSFFPIIVPIMPLISGAYWPEGSISNPFLLILAEFVPLTHALDALKGAALYDYGWVELMPPLVKLVLMFVVFMGVGINLVERVRK